MIDKVLRAIQDNNMFHKGDKVIVGLSGGPDSVCLIHVLYNIKDKLGISLYGAHVNHCLRGQEADLDEAYAKNLCHDFNIPFYVTKVDIHKISKERNISCEMAGREVRYEFFSSLIKKVDGNKIALAHNANDQVETVLMRIMRGTGLDGLIGIKPVRDEIYVRPILAITRDEIESYCNENNLKPRIDKTNLENIFARNKIRLELIPYIRENFNSDIVATINRMANTVKVDGDYLESNSSKVYSKCCKKENEKIIVKKEAFKEHEAILTRVLRKAINNLKGDLNNFEREHIYDIIKIQKHETGKKIMLPQKVIALNSYGDIHIYLDKAELYITKKKEEFLLKLGENYIDEENIYVNLQLVNDFDELNYENLFIRYFDYDKIKDNMTLRYRREGDVFTPLGMKGIKTLKKMFVDLKIPREERANIPLICFDNNIAWITGYRVSEKYKINKHTKNILQISLRKGV